LKVTTKRPRSLKVEILRLAKGKEMKLLKAKKWKSLKVERLRLFKAKNQDCKKLKE
jgi:hypothetical protein